MQWPKECLLFPRAARLSDCQWLCRYPRVTRPSDCQWLCRYPRMRVLCSSRYTIRHHVISFPFYVLAPFGVNTYPSIHSRSKTGYSVMNLGQKTITTGTLTEKPAGIHTLGRNHKGQDKINNIKNYKLLLYLQSISGCLMLNLTSEGSCKWQSWICHVCSCFISRGWEEVSNHQSPTQLTLHHRTWWDLQLSCN